MMHCRKHQLSIALAAGLALAALSATSATSAKAALRVVTTTTDLGYMARTIGGSRVHVDTICLGNQDPHFVQARPSYMVMLSRADLLISVGFELEVGWLPALVQGARNPSINPGHGGYLEAGRAVVPIDVPHGPVDRSHGDIHPFGNPHFWLDPTNAELAAQSIADRMARLDPDGAPTFRANAAAFRSRIDRGMRRWRAALAPFAGMKLVSYHATFNYFFRRFDLAPIGYLEERPGIPPAPAHLAQLISQMRTQHVQVIFHESYYDAATSNLVASRSRARVLVLPTSVGGAPGIATYEQLMDHLVNQLVQAALSRSSQAQAAP